jgi:hypothetical protein
MSEQLLLDFTSKTRTTKEPIKMVEDVRQYGALFLDWRAKKLWVGPSVVRAIVVVVLVS